MVLTSCTRVVATSADELFLTDRYASTASGMSASLCFSEGEGELRISIDDNEEVVISGAVCADKEKFYITSRENGRTYEFFYRAFADRAEVTYLGETLVFYPLEQSSQTVE